MEDGQTARPGKTVLDSHDDSTLRYLRKPPYTLLLETCDCQPNSKSSKRFFAMLMRPPALCQRAFSLRKIESADKLAVTCQSSSRIRPCECTTTLDTCRENTPLHRSPMGERSAVFKDQNTWPVK